MTATPLIAGVELGGTKTVCLLAAGPDDVRDEARIPTTTPEETLGAVRAVLEGWKAAHDIAAIGVASFGPLELAPASPEHGQVINTPKPGWSGAPVLAAGQGLGAPVGFDTDVNAAALAEGRWGAARGLGSFAYVTVGTGIGVGVIVDGRPVTGLGHAEAGHLRIPRLAKAGAFAGVCPYHGDCVEGLASGPAIAARAGRESATLPADDSAWDEPIHALAMLCHNLALTVLPQRILIGGGVGMGQPHLLARVRRALVESLNGYGAAPRIAADIDAYLVPPGLGDRAGPLGAIALGLTALGR